MKGAFYENEKTDDHFSGFVSGIIHRGRCDDVQLCHQAAFYRRP